MADRMPPPLLPQQPSEEDLAAYIAERCAELRRLSLEAPFRTLNYLLDQTRLEAERTAKILIEEKRRHRRSET